MMKKFLFLLLLSQCVIVSAQTQKQKVNVSEVQAVATTKAENYAEITFDTLRYNFGTLHIPLHQHWHSPADYPSGCCQLRLYCSDLYQGTNQARREGHHRCDLRRHRQVPRTLSEDDYRPLQRNQRGGSSDYRRHHGVMNDSPAQVI